MNWYKHYIGDYHRDTNRLTIRQHGVYRLLLDEYYATEKPLPLDVEECCRVVHAANDEERADVALVLDRYFDALSDGYHSKKADLLIAKSSAQRTTNRRITEQRTAKRTVPRSENEPSNDSSHEQPTYQTPDTRHQTERGKVDLPIDHFSIPDFCEQRQPPANGEAPELAKAFENWNITADEFGLPRAEKLTEGRKRKLRQRLKEHRLDGWNKALTQFQHSAFLQGKNDRGWRPTLDFLLQDSSFTKVLEGAYNDEEARS